MINSKCKKKST